MYAKLSKKSVFIVLLINTLTRNGKQWEKTGLSINGNYHHVTGLNRSNNI